MTAYHVSRDPTAVGLAQVLEQLLLTSSLDPRRAHKLRRLNGTVMLTASDAGVSVVLDFHCDEGVLVRRASPKRCTDVSIVTTTAWLTAMPRVPRIAGLTNPFTPEGRAFMRAVRRKEIAITGYRNLSLLRGTAAVL
jgi:hypothetical protein